MLHRGFSQLRLVGAVLGPSPGIDRALVQRLLFVGNDQVDIEINGVAEALAALAGAVRIIEREQPGLWFAVDAMAEFAFKCLGKTQPPRLGLFIPRNRLVNNLSRLAEPDLRGIDDPGPVLRGNHQAIDQRIERLAEVQVEQRLGGGEFYNFAVLVQAVESARAQFIEPFLERIVGKRGVGWGFCLLSLFGLSLGCTPPASRETGRRDACPRPAPGWMRQSHPPCRA